MHLPGALVLGQSVVEGDFLVAETGLLAARPCRPDVLGKLDQFFEHLRRRDGIGVIAGNRRFEAFRECLGLRDVALGLRAHIAVDELLQRLDGEVLLLGLAYLGEELVGQDRDVGAFAAQPPS